MSDLISREAALKKIVEYFRNTDPKGEEQFGVLKCSRLIRTAPAVDAEPVRHGQWSGNSLDFSCSVCGVYQNIYTGRTNYCPNCGAKMDGR